MEAKKRVRLSIEVEPALHRRVKIAAAERGTTIKNYVATVLAGVVEEEFRRKGGGEEDVDLAGLSVAAFGRDRKHGKDAVYGDLR